MTAEHENAAPASESATHATTTQSKSDRKMGRRALRALLTFLLLLGTGAYFLPSLASQLLKQPQAISWISDSLPGQIEVGEANVSWQQPLVFKDVTVKSPEGKKVATVKSVRSEDSLWTMLLNPEKTLHLNFDGLRLAVIVPQPKRQIEGRMDVSTIVKQLQTFKLPQPARDLQIDLANMRLEFRNPKREILDAWDNVSGTYTFHKQSSPQQNVTIIVPGAQPEAGPSLKLTGSVQRTPITGTKKFLDLFTLQTSGHGVSVNGIDTWLDVWLGEEHQLTRLGGTLQGTLKRDPREGWNLDVTARLEDASSPSQQFIDEERVAGIEDKHLMSVAFEENSPPTALGNRPIDVNLKTRFDRDSDELNISTLKVESENLSLDVQGEVTELSGQEFLMATASMQTLGTLLLERLPEDIREQVKIEGAELSGISIQGPLQPKGAPFGSGMQIGLQVSWKSIEAFGLSSQKGAIQFRLLDGVLIAEPQHVVVNNGELQQLPRLDLNVSPPVLKFETGRILDRVELTEDACRTWLKYFSPTLAEATRVDGTFSLDVEQGEIPIGELDTAQLHGALSLTGEVRPGPLTVKVLQSVRTQFASQRQSPLSEEVLVTIDNDKTPIWLEEGRVYHDAFLFHVRDVDFSTRGSVGLDETLDLVAHIQLPEQWFENAGPVLRALEGESLDVAITGTLQDPDFDAASIADIGKRIGVKAGMGLLEQIMERREERRGRRRR